jgi:hypothetical protein
MMSILRFCELGIILVWNLIRQHLVHNIDIYFKEIYWEVSETKQADRETGRKFSNYTFVLFIWCKMAHKKCKDRFCKKQTNMDYKDTNKKTENEERNKSEGVQHLFSWTNIIFPPEKFQAVLLRF